MNGFLKFVMVSGAGFLLDLAIALGLHENAELPLWLAATISFFVVAGLNYLLFEFWIFRDPGKSFSWVRLAGVLVASIAAAAARVGAILGLTSVYSALIAEGRALSLALLVSGAAVSVVVNYVLNKRLVFARKV